MGSPTNSWPLKLESSHGCLLVSSWWVLRYFRQTGQVHSSRASIHNRRASYLSRQDTESLSEKRVHSDGTWKDIWDGHVLRNLRGPDGHLFARPTGDDLHLVFSLGVDGFNPGVKRTGKNTGSVQGIYMICLNIPIERRYDPENMFLVGLIPGPNKPSLDEINHGIKPLVDDLLDCWDPGLFISRTAMRRHRRQGRLILPSHY